MDIELTPYRDKKICIAFSGGSDSTALLDYLIRFGKPYGITVSAVHCEHGIRGEESLSDADYVKAFCKERAIPLYFFSCDCVALAKEKKVSLETAARDFRYSCFEKLLAEKKADYIATAHHLEDNAETILFRLCRGSSLSGLKGIADRTGFIRPMLSVKKQDVLSYLKQQGLTYRTDSTNFDTAYTRNAIREEILPALEREIPGTKENLARFSFLAQEDDEFLYSLAQKTVETDGKDFWISFSEKPICRRAILIALKKLGVEKDYTQEHLRSVYSLWEKENSAKISLPNGVIAIKEYDKICLYRHQERCFDEVPLVFGKNELHGQTILITKEPCAQAFDKNKLPKDCVLRFRREGDIFTKFGGGTKKLKEYLNDKKIPLRKRDFIPLIAKENEILCAVGVEISDSIKTEPNSDVWYIHLKHEGE